MRLLFIIIALLSSVTVSAQDTVPVKGRVINESGDPVEYVHIYSLSNGFGAISTADGLFDLKVPECTLTFQNVSYEASIYAVSGPEDDLVIVLKHKELPPAVSYGGEWKEKRLLGRGIPLSSGFISPDDIGTEMGSLVTVSRPFHLQHIRFSVPGNGIPGCVVSVSVYRIDAGNTVLESALHEPIYLGIDMSGNLREYVAQPEGMVVLEPGRYFISLMLVGYEPGILERYLSLSDEERAGSGLKLEITTSLKKGYFRQTAYRDEAAEMSIRVTGRKKREAGKGRTVLSRTAMFVLIEFPMTFSLEVDGSEIR